MTALAPFLTRDICILALGSIGDLLDSVPAALKPHIHGIFLDAVDAKAKSHGVRIDTIEGIVAPHSGEATLTVRKWVYCSSAVPAISAVVKDFGLEEYFVPVRQVTAPAVTIADLAARFGVSFDYIKTDIEGWDGPVMEAAGLALENVLVAAMELRFLPNYEGEPFLDEVVRMMRQHNFEVLRVDVENWRYKTVHRDNFFDGRSVFANVTFVRSPSAIQAQSDAESQFVRQCVVLAIAGRPSYAEYLLEKFLGGLPTNAREELQALIHSSAAAQKDSIAKMTGSRELSAFFNKIRFLLWKKFKDKSGFDLKHIDN